MTGSLRLLLGLLAGLRRRLGRRLRLGLRLARWRLLAGRDALPAALTAVRVIAATPAVMGAAAGA